jgi:glycerophosphoryl diester phosphodiesterase
MTGAAMRRHFQTSAPAHHRTSRRISVAPENTLAAFERALADGADGVEFDVRLARDNVPVVIHDATLQRTAGLDARVASLTSSELSAINAGSWFNQRFPARAVETYAREIVRRSRRSLPQSPRAPACSTSN